MSPSVHRRLGDSVAGKGGPIGGHQAATHRHHVLAAARVTSSSCSSPAEVAESAPPSPSPWHPLPPSLPKRRRVVTAASSSADAASVPASFKRTAARMTWPPERTPSRDLDGCGGALSSTKPRRGLTRKEEYLGWLGSLRSGSGPQAPRALAPRRDAGAGAGASTTTSPSASAPPSPTASSAARVPHLRRSGGINASSSSNTISSAAPIASPLGSSTPAHLSALATASNGDRRPPPPPPPTKQPAGTRQRSKDKQPTGSAGALAPIADAPSPQTDRPPPPTADAPSPQTDRPPLPTAFGHSLIEVLLSLNYDHRGAPPPHQTKLITETPGGASLLQNNAAALALGAPAFPRLDALSQRIIEVLFDLNYGHLGYAGVVLMGVYAGLMELVSGWSAILKVFYVLLLILGAFGLGTGLMAATSIAPTGYTHRVSSVCSRLCTCLATFVFIVALACHMGSHGYIVGIVLGVLAVCYMVSVWIEGDPGAYGAYTSVWTATKDLWLRFKRSDQRGPILP